MIKSITTTYFSPEVHYSIAHWSVRPLQPYPILLNQPVYQDSSYTWDRSYFELFLFASLPLKIRHYNTFAGFVSLCQIHSLPFLYFLSSINNRKLQQHQPHRSFLSVYSNSFTSSIIVNICTISLNLYSDRY